MILTTLLRAIHPFQIVTLLSTYALGGGLVQYVRGIESWLDFLMGGLFLLVSVLAVAFMRLQFELNDDAAWPRGALLAEIKQTRLIIFVVTAALLTIAVTIVIGWISAGVLWQGAALLLLILVVLGGLYYLSAVIKSLRPYQILVEVMLFVVLPPAWAYLIQSQDVHRLLSLVVIGVSPAYMAYRFLVYLQQFGRDEKDEILSPVTSIGWEKAMVFHNALILLTYLMYALAALLGFPWFLLWPVFLTLPIGLLEIWLMERVRAGGKPLWTVMQMASLSVLFLPVYLLSMAFWLR